MRHKLLGLIVPFTLMLSLMAIPAKAGDGEWNVAVGVKGISGDLDTSGNETEGHSSNITAGGVEEFTKASVTKSVEVGAIFLEFAGRDGWGGITAGFEWIPGSATLGSSSRTDSSDVDSGQTSGSKTYVAKAEVENIISFYLEPTIYAGNFGLYAKAGVTTLELNTLEDISSGINSSTYPDKTMVGGVLGAGIRWKHSSGFLVKLEHTETNFNTYNAQSTTGNLNRIQADVDFEATSLALGFQF